MEFNFNKNITINALIESGNQDAINALINHYKKTGQTEKLQQLLKRYNIVDPIVNVEKPKIQQSVIEKPKKLNNIIDSIDNESFKAALQTITDIHKQILNMYVNTLYEDNWDKSTIKQFESLMDAYNKNLEYIKNNISKVEWNSESNKAQFMKLYKDIIEADAKAWNRVQVRNANYLRYRTNRKSIILQIADIIGGIKNTKEGNLQDVFRYYNNKCANIKLYDNSDKTDKKDYLALWFKPNLNKIMDDLLDSNIISGSIDAVVLSRIFKVYVTCRKMAYAIFNLMTSNSEFNGYDKWHNRLIDYCDATLNDRQMEILMNAVSSEGQFEDVDDYHIIMDEESWENKGINESWFDDSLEYYQSHKERYNKSKINKINMVPTNANQCRVICDGKNVYANATFYPGDIIEICPTKKIDKSALYSKDMRESVFEVVPNEEWVLPYGYCRFYLSEHLGDGNCNYIWDPVNRVIVIKAINKIPKYSKLFLNIQI